MGNKTSRVKGASKSMKTQKSLKGSKSPFRTRSLNSLPQAEFQTTKVTKPKPISSSRDRKNVVSCDQLQGQTSIRDTNVTQHRRQNTAPEINVHLGPRSLKLSDFSLVVHQPETTETIEESVDIPFNLTEPIPEELCHICSVYTGKIKYLCRVCYQVYHLGCLKKLEQHQPSPIVCYLNRADKVQGWSCHQCDNLVGILSETEMNQLISTIEKYNIKQGRSIYRQQYLCYKKAAHRDTHKEETPDDVIADERSIFDKMDTKNIGQIEWEQFINSEAIRVLEKRSKNQLVKLLTQAELFSSQQTFLTYDHDRDGEITRFESRMAQMQHFRDISCFPTPTPNKLFFTDEEIGGVIKWMDYLRDQAICILASRRNSFCKEEDDTTNQPETKKPVVSQIPDVIQTIQSHQCNPDDQNVQHDRGISLEGVQLRNELKTPPKLNETSQKLPGNEHHEIDKSLLLDTDGEPVLLRSKSTVVKRTTHQLPSLPKASSVDQTIMDEDLLSEPNLRKASNVCLLKDDNQSKVAENGKSSSEFLDSTAENMTDVVKRFPKNSRGQTMSLYVYESKRRMSKENTAIRRPVSVVGLEMEPPDLVSKLSVKLKTRESSVSQNSIHRVFLNDKNKFDKILIEQMNDTGNDMIPECLSDSNKPSATENLTTEKEVEIREKEDVFQEIAPTSGKYRASDSEIIKSERAPKSTRGQTTSLFVTRSERLMLLHEHKDRRPMSLG